MNFDQARTDILTWVASFVEKPHPKLNNWSPCPFARKARLDGKFNIVKGRDPFADLMNFKGLKEYDVIAYVYDPKKISAEEFERQIKLVNSAFLIDRDLIALSDHPDSPEIVNGVSLNQGNWAIAFVQPKSKIEVHARDIAAKGYYDSWPEDYLQAVFEHREDPRSA